MQNMGVNYWMFILILKKMLFDHDLLFDHAQESL